MGVDLIPRNKKVDDFSAGGFFWSWMLDSGVGLCIGTAQATSPSTFSYIPDKKGRCPRYNDGFRVTAEEAIAMTHAAYGLASSCDFIAKEWSKLSKEDRSYMEKSYILKKPVREDWVKKVMKFSKFAKNSSGFTIN